MGIERQVSGPNFTTDPEPCAPERGFAHHWIIKQDTPGDPYAGSYCKYCPKQRLFKMGWPQKLDWQALKAARLAEERRRAKETECLST